jgi:hypothetical protein
VVGTSEPTSQYWFSTVNDRTEDYNRNFILSRKSNLTAVVPLDVISLVRCCSPLTEVGELTIMGLCYSISDGPKIYRHNSLISKNILDTVPKLNILTLCSAKTIVGNSNIIVIVFLKWHEKSRNSCQKYLHYQKYC